MENKQVFEALKKVPLFEGLNKKNLEIIAKVATPRHFNEGEIILRQGENGTGFFMIESGTVKVYRETHEGRVHLNELGPGDFFGEMALFDETPRSATVVSTSPITCYVITSWSFKDALEDAPTIAVQMLPVIVRRLQQVQELL